MKTEICVKCKKEIPDDNENRYYQERTLEPLCSDCAMEIERQMFM
jgi:NAD-dependent SIR2 family protein deacetylase